MITQPYVYVLKQKGCFWKENLSITQKAKVRSEKKSKQSGEDI